MRRATHQVSPKLIPCTHWQLLRLHQALQPNRIGCMRHAHELKSNHRWRAVCVCVLPHITEKSAKTKLGKCAAHTEKRVYLKYVHHVPRTHYDRKVLRIELGLGDSALNPTTALIPSPSSRSSNVIIYTMPPRCRCDVMLLHHQNQMPSSSLFYFTLL